MALSNVITFSIKFDDYICASFNTNGTKLQLIKDPPFLRIMNRK